MYAGFFTGEGRGSFSKYAPQKFLQNNYPEIS
jgi:hypothetical protein